MKKKAITIILIVFILVFGFIFGGYFVTKTVMTKGAINYLQNKYNIKYLLSDFKKEDGYKRSIELSKKYELYRQDYCGCLFSKERNVDE